jgi:hypothetical protein
MSIHMAKLSRTVGLLETVLREYPVRLLDQLPSSVANSEVFIKLCVVLNSWPAEDMLEACVPIICRLYGAVGRRTEGGVTGLPQE